MKPSSNAESWAVVVSLDKIRVQLPHHGMVLGTERMMTGGERAKEKGIRDITWVAVALQTKNYGGLDKEGGGGDGEG